MRIEKRDSRFAIPEILHLVGGDLKGAWEMCLHKRHETNKNPRPQSSLRPSSDDANRLPESLPPNHARPVARSEGHGHPRTRRREVSEFHKPLLEPIWMADARPRAPSAPGGRAYARRAGRQQEGPQADREGHSGHDDPSQGGLLRGTQLSGDGARPKAGASPRHPLCGGGHLARSVVLQSVARQGGSPRFWP